MEFVIREILRYYHTIRHLKRSQVFGRLLYRVKNLFLNSSKYYRHDKRPKLRNIKLVKPIERYPSYLLNNRFTFINQSHTFKGKIDWNYSAYGKLWTYNLNYFDFINQEKISKNEGLRLIRDFIKSEKQAIIGKEPYPVSLRIINWLKFIYTHKVEDPEINKFLYGDLINLRDNLEYHLLGNHLLENAFALTIGGYCLQQEDIYNKGKRLLNEQLTIQLCSDGGHYELSPMYHQILLDRLLDTINFLGQEEERDLLNYAEKMLSWLENITFNDESIPYLSDSAPGIAPATRELLDYAKRLGIDWEKTGLSDSGYRTFGNQIYECIVDGGGLGPEYHTGHGHSDAASFLLRVNNQPVIVDTGISTYEEGERRLMEKSVVSHNTTHPEDIEPSEMWKSFRVARREKVSIIEENKDSITIERKLPYKAKQVLKRRFDFKKNSILISDVAEYEKSSVLTKAYLHFAPGLDIYLENERIITEVADFEFEGSESIQIETYFKADGYNKLVESKKVSIQFRNNLQTLINLKIEF